MSATAQHLAAVVEEVKDLEKRLGMAQSRVAAEQAELDLIAGQLESAKQLKQVLEAAS